MSTADHLPAALVLGGDMDLVRPLAMAGIPTAVVTRPGAAARYSRSVLEAIAWPHPDHRPDELLQRLLAFARLRSQAPVLYYQNDEYLQFAARYGEQLRTAFRVLMPDARRIAELVDKVAFDRLATRLGLPVPPAQVVRPMAGGPGPPALSFPVLLKPPSHRASAWTTIDARGKALRIDTARQLADVWSRLVAAGGSYLAQQIVPGPETRIESYHTWVDQRGEIAGEFAGRKLRTTPRHYGFSTAVTVTDEADVVRLGRRVILSLALRGVAKVDFKRGPNGQLHLLEVNPRFNLWHHPGAVAGVNLPALAWADLSGRPRPPAGAYRAGVSWCSHRDLQAAREWGVPLARWLPWALRCEAKSALAWDDPLPLVAAVVWRAGQRARRLGPRRDDAVDLHRRRGS